MISLLTSIQICFIIGVAPSIEVIYPQLSAKDSLVHIANVDSNFIFGSVSPPDASLNINGFDVKVEDNGAFLAFLPVDWQSKRYVLTAALETEESSLILPIASPSPPAPLDRPDVEFPRLVELSGGVARTHPKGAYYIFPLPEARAIAEEWQNGYYKLPLTPQRAVWIEGIKYVKDVGRAYHLKTPIVWKADVRSVGKWVEIRIPLERKPLYRAWVDVDLSKIIVEVYHVISHIDRISYHRNFSPIEEVIWDQPEEEVIRLEVLLNEPCWGYKVDWNNGDFIVKVRKAPDLSKGIKGLHFAIDAGHGGGDYGAIGPTGLTEKEVNLKAAIALANLLNKKGAKVTVTRVFDRYIDLYDRIDIAEAADADILISLHNNALSDGVNPNGNFGTSVHYYRPFSRLLALSVQKELVKGLHFLDESIYYNNLALVRPTTMPAVLVEAAYIMFPEHEARLREAGFAEIEANAIYLGLCRFVKEYRETAE
ncbi:MAG: N-acetylmuramoyl-L-alanine amidase [Calditrichaeota bacterium]|nr:N-acetylmuramoyl-L-alanine amidase [Calditrichota bacterium]